MKKLSSLLLIFAAAGLLSCGSGGEEPALLVECGEGTVEDNGICVPSGNCPEGTFTAPDGRCVDVDYCAEGTHLDLTRGTCVADPSFRCGPDTFEEDGECFPEFVTSCGEGTVAADGRCRPYEEVCGPGTTQTSQSNCRPSGEICGEGTTYDVQLRQCVRTSSLTCGPGTIIRDDQCLPLSAVYSALMENPDLDKTAPGAPEEITLKEAGEPFVFIGTITTDSEHSDDAPRASEDIYRFQGQAGQILRIGVYSLGLPNPGFTFIGENGSYERLSDLGAGIEASRQLVLPMDGEYELTVSSILQLSERGEAMGGDDWDYVGFIEVVDAPTAQNVSITNALLTGSVKNAQENLFRIVGAQEDARFPLFLVNLPLHANLEFLIWEEGSGLVARNKPGDEPIMILPAPAEEFYLYVDYGFATGASLNYSARVSTDGIRTEVQELEAGQYLRISQSNQGRVDLNISIDLDGTIVGEQSLADVTTDDPGRYAHHFSPAASTAYVTAYTDTGAPLNDFELSLDVIDATKIEDVDGEPLTINYQGSLEAQQIHYFIIESTYLGLLSISIDGADGDTNLSLYDSNGVAVGSDVLNTLVFDSLPQTYHLAVEALEPVSTGFELSIDIATIFAVSEESTPNIAIPDSLTSGVSDTIRIQNCPIVAEIDMDIHITHTWRGDLHVRLKDPSGTTRSLFARSGGSADHLIGNLNNTIQPETGSSASSTAEPIANFVGTTGTGDWVLTVSDDAGGDSGVFASWTLNLICEG